MDLKNVDILSTIEVVLVVKNMITIKKKKFNADVSEANLTSHILHNY